MNEHNYIKLLYLKDTDGCGKLLKNLPDEFVEYIKYTKTLHFEQKPDYSYLRFLFNKYLFNKSLNIKNISFSWIVERNKKLLDNRKNIININYRPSIRIINNFNKEKIKKINKTNSSYLKDYKNNSNSLTNFNNESEQINKRDNKILKNVYLKERKINNNNININKNKLRNFINIKKYKKIGNVTRIMKNENIDMYPFNDDINKTNKDIINTNNNLRFNSINNAFFNRPDNKMNSLNIKYRIKKIIKHIPKSSYNTDNDFSVYISDVPLSNTTRANRINELNNRYTLPYKHQIKYSNDLIYKSPLLNNNILNLQTHKKFINNFITNRTINNRTINNRTLNNKISNFRSISQNLNQRKINNINTNNNNLYNNTINNYIINNRRLNSDNIELLDKTTNLQNNSNSYFNYYQSKNETKLI